MTKLEVGERVSVKERAVSWRAVSLGLVGTFLLAWLVPIFDLLVQGTWISSCHLPIGVFNLFALLLFANALVKFFRFRWALTRHELLVAYCMMLAGSGLPSFGFTEYMFPTLAGTLYYAHPENRWAELTFRYIPQWFVPWDVAEASRALGGTTPEQGWWSTFYNLLPNSFRPGGREVVRLFYEGITAGTPIPLSHWVVPTIAWSILALAFFFALFCVSVLLRRQWLDYDRLTFPLTQPPLEMTEGIDEPQTLLALLLRQRLIWLGAVIPFFVHGINGLHFYFPAVPEIRLSFPLNQYLTSYLFSQIGPFVAIVHFSVIGVAFLLPSDLAFSLWFFFFVFMAQSVLLTYLGWQIPNFLGYATPAHAGLQMLGAFFAIVLHLIVVGRGHWQQVLRNETPSDEPISYRTALLGFLCAILFASLWCAIAGASWGVALLSWLVLFVIAIALTRFVSEGGLLFIQAFRPSDLFIAFVGTRPFTPRQLTVMAFVEKVFMFDLRTFLMPFFMDSFRIAKVTQIPLQPLAGAMWLAILASLFSSSWSFLRLVYQKGANTMMQGAGAWFLQHSPRQVLDFTVAYIEQPRQPTPLSQSCFVIGFVFALLLYRLRQLFVWFPFHPIGYAMGPSWPMIQLWFSTMLGWLLKALLLRYGGLGAFRRFRPFFLGLLIGEYLTAGFWLVLDYSFGKVGHRFFLF
ncbi:MAG: hypothetical protein NZ937_07635 [Armatimonadetes bacterium]|nr:hypothetical protein [Armatimonadota bacterium]